MEKINHFFELTRLKKPIGYMLLFWPCVWGLTIAFDFANNVQILFKILFSFSLWIYFNEIRRLYNK